MDEQNQPQNFKFPKRSFGIKNPEQRSFQASWFASYPWLHYDQERDLAFCFTCMVATKTGKVSNSKSECAFISTGFTNWKDGPKKFRRHQDSDCHKEAVERHVTLPKVTRDIGETLSAAHSEEKADNRAKLLTILRSIRYLARQGLAFRGHDDNEGNFMQLLRHHGQSDPSIIEWLEKKTDKYTSPVIQNEVLQIMALKIIRNIAASVSEDRFYTIMVDETTDVSNREQVVLVLRHVDKDLTVHEDFVGLYMVPSIDSQTLTAIIKDTLVRMQLKINNCRGQCYDGASNMSGAKRGVAANISAEEPRAVYTHCYGHSLNLAVADTVRACKTLRDTLDTVYEITKLVKFSPKREVLFEELKQEMSPETTGVRVLCPTRWTVRADSLKSVLDNYVVLQRLWEASYESTRNTEIRARIAGVKSQMGSFEFLFGVSLGYHLLKHSDNLSKTLQQTNISASEGQDLAKLTVATITTLRSDDAFNSFWQSLDNKLNEVDVSEPALPRRRKMPKRYESGNAEHEYPETPKDLYRQKYYEALDLVINCIQDRFDQPGFQTYRRLQDALLNGIRKDETADEDISYVTATYRDDINGLAFRTQLDTLGTLLQSSRKDLNEVSLSDIVQTIRDMKPGSRTLFSEIVTVLKLILVMPATNAASERSFSALRRLKSYLRSTMGQERLNHLMVLHVHKEATDEMDIVTVAQDFVSGMDNRMITFGRF